MALPTDMWALPESANDYALGFTSCEIGWEEPKSCKVPEVNGFIF